MLIGFDLGFKSLSGHIPRSSLRSSDLLPFYHQYLAACCGGFLSLAQNRALFSELGGTGGHVTNTLYRVVMEPNREPEVWRHGRPVTSIKGEPNMARIHSAIIPAPLPLLLGLAPGGGRTSLTLSQRQG